MKFLDYFKNSSDVKDKLEYRKIIKIFDGDEHFRFLFKSYLSQQLIFLKIDNKKREIKLIDYRYDYATNQAQFLTVDGELIINRLYKDKDIEV